MIARSVVVVMPFGGKDSSAQRRAVLNFMRLAYLVEKKCIVKPTISPGDGDQVAYAVKIASTEIGDIPHDVLRQIKAAAIEIALVVEANSNVTCEVRARRDSELPVILVGDWPGVPVYEQPFVRLDWNQHQVLAQIEVLVADESQPLESFDTGIPDGLRIAIDKYDGKLRKSLEKALRQIEESLPKPIEAVEHMRGIVSEKTESYYPCSIVEINFSGRNKFDPQKPAIVTDFDDKFSALYRYPSKASAEADKPLTTNKLLNRIKEVMDLPDWDEFTNDQAKLMQNIIEKLDAKAKVPLRINDNHHNPVYAGKSHLPCIIAQVNDGDQAGPHTMYLLVEYIEIPETLKP